MVIDTGGGPPIVFSHGHMMDHSMFAPQVEALTSQFRVIAFDHRARTERWENPYDLYDLANDCHELLEQVNVKSCLLVGMSMGACMALRVALTYPNAVTGLILISGFVTPYSQGEQAIWETHYGQLRGTTQLPASFVDSEADVCFGEKTRQEHPSLVESWKRRWREYQGDAVYIESLSWIRQDDVRPALGKLGIPTLIIHGVDDAAVSAREAEVLSDRLRISDLLMVEDAGHTVNLEQPHAVTEAIAEFADRIYS